MIYNVRKLQIELDKANIPTHGCSSNGRIDFKQEATDAQKQQAETIKANHNSEWYVDKRLVELNKKSLGDQLDMQYWDKINGTTLWQDWITGIKQKFPKD